MTCSESEYLLQASATLDVKSYLCVAGEEKRSCSIRRSGCEGCICMNATSQLLHALHFTLAQLDCKPHAPPQLSLPLLCARLYSITMQTHLSDHSAQPSHTFQAWNCLFTSSSHHVLGLEVNDWHGQPQSRHLDLPIEDQKYQQSTGKAHAEILQNIIVLMSPCSCRQAAAGS